jgi:hypothetical protein
LLAIILLRARAGFEYYRAFPQDAIEDQNYSKTKLTMPVLAVGGSYYPALGGNVTDCTLSSCTFYAMKALAQNVRGIQIPLNCLNRLFPPSYSVIIVLHLSKKSVHIWKQRKSPTPLFQRVKSLGPLLSKKHLLFSHLSSINNYSHYTHN